MKTAICPGSFDPVTTGHIDVFRRAATMFDRVIVLVVQNAAKAPRFSLEERCELIRASLGDIKNVEVDSFDGMTTDYTKAHKIDAIVKGVRNTGDFEYETAIAAVLRSFDGPETVFLPCRPEYTHISTSTALHLYSLGQDVSAYLPQPVIDALHARQSL